MAQLLETDQRGWEIEDRGWQIEDAVQPTQSSTLNSSSSPPPADECSGITPMGPEHLAELVRLEESYWWHRAKRQLAAELLQSHFAPPGRLVEGGVGSARNLLEFRQMGYDVTGFDIMSEAVDHARHRGLDDVRRHDLALPWPLSPGSTRAVVLLDVLEHMADPVQVLRNAAEILEPGGGIVITVPAYPWLFGSWDRSLGHYRRYTAGELRTQAAAAGLSVRWLTHWNAFTLPAAVAVRGYDRLFPRQGGSEFPHVSPFTNSLLLACARFERWWVQRTGVPLGLSLVAVLAK